MAVMILPSHIWPKVQNTLKFVVQILDHLQTKQHISTRFVQFQDGHQILLKKKVWPNLLRQIAGMKFHIVRYVVLYPRVQVRVLGIYYFGGDISNLTSVFFFLFSRLRFKHCMEVVCWWTRVGTTNNSLWTTWNSSN